MPKRKNAEPRRRPTKKKAAEELSADVFDKLLAIYEDPANPGSFGGINKLQRAAKAVGIRVNTAQIERFLAAVPAYGVHRGMRSRRFERRRIIAMDIDWLWELDITYMNREGVPEANDGFVYLLVKIDVLSKQMAVEPLRDKSGPTTLEGLRRICARVGVLPKRIACDAGKEFNNELMRAWAADNGVRLYFVSSSAHGAAVVERVHSTLKVLLARFMRHRRSQRYVDDLQSIVDAYNQTRHSSIGMPPAAVNDANVELVRARLYPHDNFPRPAYKFAVGDRVRREVQRKDFHRGFFPQFSEQVHVIARRLRSTPPAYRLAKLDGTPVTRIFYEPQLMPVGLAPPRLRLNRFGLEDEAANDDDDDAGPSVRLNRFRLDDESEETSPPPSKQPKKTPRRR